jgi:hypothetical protein
MDSLGSSFIPNRVHVAPAARALLHKPAAESAATQMNQGLTGLSGDWHAMCFDSTGSIMDRVPSHAAPRSVL